MKKIYLVESSCREIYNAIKVKHLRYKDVSELVGVSESFICRICRGQVRYISVDLAQKLETTLNILIYDASADTEVLIRRINELEKENKLLKQLLIEKWQS